MEIGRRWLLGLAVGIAISGGDLGAGGGPGCPGWERFFQEQIIPTPGLREALGNDAARCQDVLDVALKLRKPYLELRKHFPHPEKGVPEETVQPSGGSRTNDARPEDHPSFESLLSAAIAQRTAGVFLVVVTDPSAQWYFDEKCPRGAAVKKALFQWMSKSLWSGETGLAELGRQWTDALKARLSSEQWQRFVGFQLACVSQIAGQAAREVFRKHKTCCAEKWDLTVACAVCPAIRVAVLEE